MAHIFGWDAGTRPCLSKKPESALFTQLVHGHLHANCDVVVVLLQLFRQCASTDVSTAVCGSILEAVEYFHDSIRALCQGLPALTDFLAGRLRAGCDSALVCDWVRRTRRTAVRALLRYGDRGHADLEMCAYLAWVTVDVSVGVQCMVDRVLPVGLPVQIQCLHVLVLAREGRANKIMVGQVSDFAVECGACLCKQWQERSLPDEVCASLAIKWCHAFEGMVCASSSEDVQGMCAHGAFAVLVHLQDMAFDLDNGALCTLILLCLKRVNYAPLWYLFRTNLQLTRAVTDRKWEFVARVASQWQWFALKYWNPSEGDRFVVSGNELATLSQRQTACEQVLWFYFLQPHERALMYKHVLGRTDVYSRHLFDAYLQFAACLSSHSQCWRNILDRAKVVIRKMEAANMGVEHFDIRWDLCGSRDHVLDGTWEADGKSTLLRQCTADEDVHVLLRYHAHAFFFRDVLQLVENVLPLTLAVVRNPHAPLLCTTRTDPTVPLFSIKGPLHWKARCDWLMLVYRAQMK